MSAVEDVTLDLRAGETLALVGESGSGKSTTAHAVAGLLAPAAKITAGQIVFNGVDVVRLGERRRRALRGVDIGLIPQDPSVSLNPVQRIGDQVAEVFIIHGLADRRAARPAALAALTAAGLDPERADQFPHELSGGMRQRVLIAIALAARPQLVIADEPTSALDVTVQRHILDHIAELTADAGAAVLLITHDLGIAAERADRIAVMSRGTVVEEGPAAQLLEDPRDPYTKALLAAAPSLGARRQTILARVGGGERRAPADAEHLDAEHLDADHRDSRTPRRRAPGEGLQPQRVDDPRRRRRQPHGAPRPDPGTRR